jgi:hypothetical protein
MGTAVAIAVAVVAGILIIRVGIAMLRSMGTPLPPPPPTGEMRRVNLRYRCSICGTEMKMTRAAAELPDPPRHCQEDMDLVTPVE